MRYGICSDTLDLDPKSVHSLFDVYTQWKAECNGQLITERNSLEEASALLLAMSPSIVNIEGGKIRSTFYFIICGNFVSYNGDRWRWIQGKEGQYCGFLHSSIPELRSLIVEPEKE